MRSKILKCSACGRYTLKAICSVCGGPTVNTKPARFSPEDPYGKYRRALVAWRLDERDFGSESKGSNPEGPCPG